MNNQPPIINIFEKAARKAGKSVLRDFGEIENLQIQSKNIGDFVTNTDFKSEKILLETLQYYYPRATYISEESGIIKGENETIIIDPIDGTSNFIHGIPLIGIVISRVIDEKVTDGIIFNPILNDFYWASLGKGAWCNDKRLRVSKRQNIQDCLIGTGIPYSENIYDGYLKEIDNISKKCAGIRRIGAASIDLAYVASGKLDAFWERNLKLWDMCSGVLLIKEAGGKVTLPNGKEWTIKSSDILASNNNIHDKIQSELTLL
ncbi:inositol monophosphatase [Alphaproteobacteria bacterium]|nr:inositol monophosphatase [Alphaproteobacteria bacterium]